MGLIKILLVEDNPADVALISDIVESEMTSVEITPVNDFQIFRELLHAGKHDLIICDYHCGLFDAPMVIQEIRASRIEIPVIMITGHHSLDTSLLALDLHVDDYLPKDMEYLQRLPHMIERVIRNAHLEELKRKSVLSPENTLRDYIDLYENTGELLMSIWLDGSIINVNNPWCECFGYNIIETKQLDITKIIDLDWRNELNKTLAEIRSGKQTIEAQLGFRSKNDKLILTECFINTREENGNPVASNWLMQSINTHEQKDSNLAEISDQYFTMFELAPHPMVMGDHRGVALQINQAACDLVGYSYEEIIGMHFRKITHPKDLIKSYINHRKLMSGQIDSFTMIKKYRHKKGHYIEVEVTAALIRNGQGNPRLGIAEFRPIK